MFVLNSITRKWLHLSVLNCQNILEILPLNFAPDCAKIQITGFPGVFQTVAANADTDLVIGYNSLPDVRGGD